MNTRPRDRLHKRARTRVGCDGLALQIDARKVRGGEDRCGRLSLVESRLQIAYLPLQTHGVDARADGNENRGGQRQPSERRRAGSARFPPGRV